MHDATDHETQDAIVRARLISAALPYMLRYDQKVVVVKYGGHAMGDPELAKASPDPAHLVGSVRC